MGVLASLGKLSSLRIQLIHSLIVEDVQGFSISHTHQKSLSSISGLVVEYIVAINVTRVRFPADALDRPAGLGLVLVLLVDSTCGLTMRLLHPSRLNGHAGD